MHQHAFGMQPGQQHYQSKQKNIVQSVRNLQKQLQFTKYTENKVKENDTPLIANEDTHEGCLQSSWETSVVMSFLFKIVIVQCDWWGLAILNIHLSLRYRYPLSDLRDYRIRNMHWGVLVGLVKVLRHLQYFSFSNNR